MRDPLAGKCSLVSSTELMQTWAGAEVQHVAGCDGNCDVQRRLDASAKLRRESMEMVLAAISGEDDDDEP